jgi:hypothetical protein
MDCNDFSLFSSFNPKQSSANHSTIESIIKEVTPYKFKYKLDINRNRFKYNDLKFIGTEQMAIAYCFVEGSIIDTNKIQLLTHLYAALERDQETIGTRPFLLTILLNKTLKIQ